MSTIARDNKEVAEELQERYGMDQVTWFASSRNSFPFNLSLKFILYLMIGLITMAGVCPFGTPLLTNDHFSICLGTTLAISVLAFNSTDKLIETTKQTMVRIGNVGRDLNKLGNTSEKEPV